MPNTRLILHVKGTEAETTELPKDAVRAAISEGKMTHSQLIWSPNENAWKQVRELPDLLPVERFILHVKGTEGGTTELTKPAIKQAISEGTLSRSQLIWRPTEQKWRQAKDVPELLPSQKLMAAPAKEVPAATAPVAAPKTGEVPVARMTVSVDTPKARVAAADGVPQAKPQVKAATATVSATPVKAQARAVAASPVKVSASAKPAVKVSASGMSAANEAWQANAPGPKKNSEVPLIKHDEGIHIFKWISIGLGSVLALIFLLNYILVDRPLNSNLSSTSYSNVSVHGHFGSFLQPNAILIHIPASTKLTADNLPDFLVALAHSTPHSPITRDIYGRVAITSGWKAEYTFSGQNWQQIGDLDQDTSAQRKEFLMTVMCDAAGDPIMSASNLSDDIQQQRRDQAWKTIVSHFSAAK